MPDTSQCIYLFLNWRITIQAITDERTATEVLLTIMTIPTLASLKFVQFCGNQKTGIRNRNTLARNGIYRKIISPDVLLFLVTSTDLTLP